MYSILMNILHNIHVFVKCELFFNRTLRVAVIILLGKYI